MSHSTIFTHGHGYHGIAQLRRYIEGAPTSVRAFEYSQRDIRWQAGAVTFSEGATLLHHYALSSAPLQGDIHFHGTQGAMTGHTIQMLSRK